MGKQKLKRDYFFWIDQLHITRNERRSVSILIVIITVLSLLNVFIKPRLVPPPENYEEILAEFERRSALIAQRRLEIESRYSPANKLENVTLATETHQELIPLNTATVDQLIQLPGIGQTYAKRIVEYRETNGDFSSVEELVDVQGIGVRTLEKLRPYIKL